MLRQQIDCSGSNSPAISMDRIEDDESSGGSSRKEGERKEIERTRKEKEISRGMDLA